MRTLTAAALALALSAPEERLPSFAFENYDGRSITAKTLEGRTTIVVPTYAKCVAACPVVTFFLDELDRTLGSPEHLQFLLISVQPEADTRPEILSHFKNHEIDP